MAFGLTLEWEGDVNRAERCERIEQILNEHRIVSADTFLKRLGISRATFKRDIEYIREQLDLRIIWDASVRGYRFDDYGKPQTSYSLSDTWLNPREVHALLVLRQLLDHVQPTLLGRLLEPLVERAQAYIQIDDSTQAKIRHRVAVFTRTSRPVDGGFFEKISRALLEREQLKVEYLNRLSQVSTEHIVSPQRLVYYRDNWYLDGWCHRQERLHRFSLAAFRVIEYIEETKAHEISHEVLDKELGIQYGVFDGARTRVARLRFATQGAEDWLADENWHPKQRGWYGSDGRYYLEVPFRDQRELLENVLRHGAQVEVLKPRSLRQLVAKAHRDAAHLYDVV